MKKLVLMGLLLSSLILNTPQSYTMENNGTANKGFVIATIPKEDGIYVVSVQGKNQEYIGFCSWDQTPAYFIQNNPTLMRLAQNNVLA